jgi:hypothetical protein
MGFPLLLSLLFGNEKGAMGIVSSNTTRTSGGSTVTTEFIMFAVFFFLCGKWSMRGFLWSMSGDGIDLASGRVAGVWE